MWHKPCRTFHPWCPCIKTRCLFNSLRPRQNGRHFADDTFKPIFLNENIRISIEISPKFVPKVPINNIPALVQIMAWRWPGDKPLSKPMMVCLLTHICVTRPHSLTHLSHPHWTKRPPSRRWHFQLHFHELLFFNFYSLKLVSQGSIDNKSALFQVVACCRTGDKPLPESMQRLVVSWWCYKMETFAVLLALCAGNSLVIGDAVLWCFFYLRLNKRLSKQSRRQWFETPSRSLWRRCNFIDTKALTEMKLTYHHCGSMQFTCNFMRNAQDISHHNCTLPIATTSHRVKWVNDVSRALLTAVAHVSASPCSLSYTDSQYKTSSVSILLS